MEHIKSRLGLLLSYDGTTLKGWQQTDMGESVESHLKRALEYILQEEVKPEAASRTDAGVHASGQVVHVDLTKIPKLEFSKLIRGINGLLPHSIVVRDLAWLPPSFHASLNAVGKEYHYYIWFGETMMPPHLRLYVWRCFFQLDQEKMVAAGQKLLGTQSFEALCNDKGRTNHQSYTRRLDRVDIHQVHPDLLRIEMEGNSFLYRMARNIAGLLVACGRGHIDVEQIPAILEQGDRRKAGVTAPSEGLFLHRVIYPQQDLPLSFLERTSPALERWRTLLPL